MLTKDFAENSWHKSDIICSFPIHFRYPYIIRRKYISIHYFWKDSVWLIKLLQKSLYVLCRAFSEWGRHRHALFHYDSIMWKIDYLKKVAVQSVMKKNWPLLKHRHKVDEATRNLILKGFSPEWQLKAMKIIWYVWGIKLYCTFFDREVGTL